MSVLTSSHNQDTFGVTEPLRLNCATAEDLLENDELVQWLDINYPSESNSGLRKRWGILVDLERMITEWVQGQLGSSTARARVLTFGSFRLGVITPFSDIDTLVLIPQGISREAFFVDFAQLMRNLSDVTECNSVPDARVPVVKVKFRGVFLDILASRVPDKYLLNSNQIESIEDSLIFQVEEKCMKSMNGVRVADRILQLVPDPQTFRTATRFVKFWAQRRLIYNNAIGYIGGVSWAILVGRICQLFPFFSAKQVVERFFFTYSNWPWSENKPVMLAPILDWKIPYGLQTKAGQYKEWNPNKYPGERFQSMPIITPIFPTHNTAYNVTESQKAIIVQEIQRGREIIELMHFSSLARNDDSNKVISWDHLCHPFPFFSVFNRLIRMHISAADEAMLLKFKGLVESRMRAFVKSLELVEKFIQFRPHPDFFRFGLPVTAEGCFYIGMGFMRSGDFDLSSAIVSFYAETMEKGVSDWQDDEVVSALDEVDKNFSESKWYSLRISVISTEEVQTNGELKGTLSV